MIRQFTRLFSFIDLRNRILKYWLLLAVLASGSVFILVFSWFLFAPFGSEVRMIVRGRMAAPKIAEKLVEKEVIVDSTLFLLLVRLRGEAHSLKAGEYLFSPGESLYTTVKKLTHGNVITYRTTFPEGQTVRQIVKQLNEIEELEGEIRSLPGEGELFPDTYTFSAGQTREEIIALMQRKMKKTINELWADRQENLYIQTKEEALVLASIIERETGQDAERARIAGVFYNRLNRGIPLQTDPTLIYWESDKVGVLNRGLRKSELRRLHPYNSYRHKGLPPTPIANPGRAALEATLNPMETDELFFVANGRGGHNFSKTLAEHNDYVREWRKIEKRRKKQN